MKKDIKFHEVQHVAVAITRSLNIQGVKEYHAYIINYNDFSIDNVLISTRGYGTIDGEEKKTSTLRHMIESVNGCDFKLIEPVNPDLFQLSNEFWISFYVDGQLRDKKYIFVPGSIREEHFQLIPWINKEGVVHE